MNTPEIKISNERGFRRDQEKKGGVRPSLLPHGTVIIVETDSYMYEVTIDKTSFPTTRYRVVTASKMIQKAGEHVIKIDSRYRKLKLSMEDWIGKGMCMHLRFGTGTNILTGPVHGATIKGKGFEYDVWRDE